MNKFAPLAALALSVAAAGAGVHAGEARVLKTIVDATSGVTRIDLGASGDSPGDMVVFDEALLDETGAKIGSNSGFCVRTLPGQFSECQWTLTLADGAITVAGREADAGLSSVPIVGGTGAYAGASGVMTSAPGANHTFTQVLTFNASAR
jgi:hypothetical protein